MVPATVAVIIPTYNRAGDVLNAIESLLQQTQPPDEIIIVDDGSTDDTVNVLQSYMDRILLIQHEQNQGLAAARNTGMSASTSDYIAFLDSDDTLLPDSIARRAVLLDQNPKYDVVYGDAWMIFTETGQCTRFSEVRRMERPTGDVFAAFALRNLSPAHTYMFRRICLEKTGQFDVTMRRLEDHDFWLRMSAHHAFLYLDEAIANYFIHEDMMSIQFNQEMREHRLRVQRSAINMPRFAELSPSQKARVYTDYGAAYAAVYHDMREARHWLIQAIRQQPRNPRAMLFWLATWGGPFFYDQLNELRRRLQKLRRRRNISATMSVLPE